MSGRLERTLKGLILVGLALFLTHSIINGTLLFYISRRFAWLTWVATIILLFIAFAYQKRPLDGTHHHHDHHLEKTAAWTALALAALPLLLGILVPARPLGAQALGVRELNSDRMGLGNDAQVLTLAASERNILDWLRAFNAEGDPVAFDGQEATVVGFVYRDETLSAGQFMVSRFVMSCCVADATGIGLVVSWPGSDDLPLDSWVEVHGRFRAGEDDGETNPILVADRVAPTTPPNLPYLYP